MDGDLGDARMHLHQILLRRSRLSKCLEDVLNNSAALGYFISYMEYRGFRHLVKFWLDAESFRISAKATERLISELPENLAVKSADLDNSCGHEVIGADIHSAMSAERHSCNSSSSSNKAFVGNIKQMVFNDADHIFCKYVAKDVSHAIGISDPIRDELIDIIYERNDYLIDPDCFLSAQQFVFNMMSHRYFSDFLKSVYYCKYLMDVVSSGDILLDDVIFNDTAMFYFTEFQFVDQLGCRAGLEFWLSADNFKSQMLSDSYTAEDIRSDAMALYNRYISMQATCPLNFGDSIRHIVENNISREEGVLPSCFDAPMRHMWQIMEKNYLPDFLNSVWFRKFLSELTNKVENHLELPQSSGFRKTIGSARSYSSGSDVISGSSLPSSLDVAGLRDAEMHSSRRSTRKTPKRMLIARHSLKSNNDTFLCANSNALPSLSDMRTEPIWQRPDKHMRLGHIDGTGRFVREIDLKPAADNRPQRTASSHFANNIRTKVLKKPTVEAEQQMANELAQIIIKDIENMTSQTIHDYDSFV